ncbi:hypothetical protein [uncultured Faecalibaculum sp.]|uniref:hypothetical protein n=1 Tax=uncultured Faecalibaculum sp. TaxID=1729681 RepID=UPI00272E7033|nr:hypothetical protein [uncultured Faecalibaculum sp.]
MAVLEGKIYYDKTGKRVSIDREPDEIKGKIRIELSDWVKVHVFEEEGSTIISFDWYPEDSWCWAEALFRFDGDKLKILDWRDSKYYEVNYEVVND